MKRIFCVAVYLLSVSVSIAQVTATSSSGSSEGISVNKQLPFSITGKINDVGEPASIVMQYKTWKQGVFREVTEKARLIKGRFSFAGTISEPVACVLYLVKGSDDQELEPVVLDLEVEWPDGNKFFLTKGNITLNGATLKDAVIEGAYKQQDWEDLKRIVSEVKQKQAAFRKEVAVIEEKLTGVPREEAEKLPEIIAINKRDRELFEEENKIYLDYFKAHPDSYAGLQFASRMITSPSPANSKAGMDIFNSLNVDLRNGLQGKRVQLLYNSRAAISIGKLAPEFSQADNKGADFNLSSLKGKYVLIDFWASWCGPCREENPHVKKAYERFHQNNFEIVGVSLDNKKDAWLKAIADDDLPWIHVSDLKGWQNQIAVLYQIRAVPQNFLLDPAGKIIALNLRGKELEETLSKILGK